MEHGAPTATPGADPALHLTRLGWRGWRLDTLDRRILAIAVPALGSLLVEPLYVLTDTAIVGRLGETPLAGLALAAVVLNTLVWVFNFLSYGTTVRVAVRRGRGDTAGGAADALQALWLSAAIGIGVAAVVGVGAHGLASLLGDDKAAIDAATTYLRISALGLPLHFLTIASIGYLYGLPDTVRPFVVAASANGLNLVVELWLVFGLGLGIAGSAWATVVAQTLGGLVMLGIVIPRLRADGLRRLSVELRVMAEVLKVGGHLVQRTGLLLLALAMSTTAASAVGTEALAGHQIAMQLFLFLAIGVDMFKVAGQALVGHALGADDVDEAHRVVGHLYGWGWRSGLVLTLAVLVLAPVLPVAFTGEAQVQDLATVALVGLAAMQLPGAFTFVLDGVLMGANDFGHLRWQTTLAFVVALPVFVAVRIWPSLGLPTVWLGLWIWMCVRAGFNHHRVVHGRWVASAATVR